MISAPRLIKPLTLGYVLEITLIALLYVATARIGQMLAIPPGNVTAVWLPSGIILAAMLIRGPYLWPGIFIGAFAGNIWAYIDFSSLGNFYRALFSGVLNGAGDSIGALVAAWQIKHYSGDDTPLLSGRNAGYFILYGALINSAISAIFGVSGLVGAGFVELASYPKTWFTWWIGDAVGILLLTPLILFAFHEKHRALSACSPMCVISFVVLLSAALGFSLDVSPFLTPHFSISTLIIMPILMLAVFKLGATVSHIGVLIVAAATIIATVIGKGPYTNKDISTSLLELQIFIALISTIILFLNAIIIELKQAKLEAEQANDSKLTFLSRMSHELRTPLNAVIGFSQLIAANRNPKGDNAKIAQSINSAGIHLLRLVNDILDVAQPGTKRTVVELKDCNLKDAVETAAQICVNSFSEKKFDLNLDQLEYTVKADNTRLIQIITNLLSNAMKYSLDDNRISIEASELLSGDIQIRIIDHGVGISNADQSLLFEPFTRLAYAEKNEIAGTGIGLSLCKFLVEEMGGEIGVKSALGQGSCFYFRLAKGGPLVDTKPKPTTNNVVEFLSHERPKNIDKASDRANTNTVLYIEDDHHCLELMKLTLRKHPNIDLHIAECAEDGIEKAVKYKPKLILIDLNLPGIDGTRAMRRLRAIAPLASSKMIALSASALPEQVEQALEAGFDNYITKPIDYGKLAKMLSGEMIETSDCSI